MNTKQQQKKDLSRDIMENIIFHLIRSLYIIFAVSRACVYKTYRFLVPPIREAPTNPPPNYEDIYKKYIHIYATPEKNPDANINIDVNLYDYEKRKEIFKEEKNECEEHWKRKLMYEFTPRGNVIVYYNPYKHAFMYYSDVNSIPYNIMQYVAKKYAVMFRCRDFYIDPEKYPDNRILEVLKKEEDALKTKSKKVNDITKCLDKDMNMNNKDIFATLKSYKQETVGTVQTTTDKSVSKKQQVPIKNQFTNTFIRLGKTCEFNIIQKPPDKNIAIMNSILFGETNISNAMDFFDHLEIEDNVVDNPFTKQDFGGVKDHNGSTDKDLTDKDPNGMTDKDPNGTTDKDSQDKDLTGTTEHTTMASLTDSHLRDLNKAKSWKEFKNLMNR